MVRSQPKYMPIRPPDAVNEADKPAAKPDPDRGSRYGVTVHAGPCGGRIEYVTKVTRRDSRGEPMEIVRYPKRRMADPIRNAQAEISRMRAEVRAMGARLDADREAMERAGLVNPGEKAEGSTRQFLTPAGELVTMGTSGGS